MAHWLWTFVYTLITFSIIVKGKLKFNSIFKIQENYFSLGEVEKYSLKQGRKHRCRNNKSSEFISTTGKLENMPDKGEKRTHDLGNANALPTS